ncbi:MAG TPA: alpha-hydroxy acid oxidase [Propionibacteriaceae bacterium]|nr:alpha-hydroxy acid oxidase [Propionibacteriaceae bacterium]
MSVDFEAEARSLLPEHATAYFSAAAGSGTSLAEGIADWAALRLRPRVLRNLSRIDSSTTVLGTEVSSPILVAPMAQQVAANPEAERAMGRAVAASNGLLGVSTNAAVPFAEISQTGAPWWFQVYVTKDRSLTELLVDRAVGAGARALMLTVDMMALLPPDVNPRNWPDVPGRERMTNLTAKERATDDGHAVEMDFNVTFDDIGWLSRISGLPVLVKGVLRGDDAAACLDAGAAGVVVSTHGGRRLGSSISAARALPEVVAAVGDRSEVYVDSGIRSGEHVAAALAMGARGVFVGRPLLWALSARGEEGVAAVLAALTTDLRQVMLQLGCPTIADLTPDLVAA